VILSPILAGAVFAPLAVAPGYSAVSGETTVLVAEEQTIDAAGLSVGDATLGPVD
jgi:hypothetical protein